MKTKVAALLLVAALALSTGCSSKPAADATSSQHSRQALLRRQLTQ
jgi:hypothetical protein